MVAFFVLVGRACLVAACQAARRPGSIIQPQATQIQRLGLLPEPGSFPGVLTKQAHIVRPLSHPGKTSSCKKKETIITYIKTTQFFLSRKRCFRRVPVSIPASNPLAADRTLPKLGSHLKKKMVQLDRTGHASFSASINIRYGSRSQPYLSRV